MKNKRRKYILLIIIVILFIGVITIYSNYNNDIYVDKDKNLSNSGLSLMIETKAGSGEYTISTSDEWPTKGYEFNAEKSACENGGTLSWDEENKSVVMTSKSSDKCYAYFDIVPPDVTIAVNNLPTTYGKLGNINCNKSDAIYNQKYNRIEISNINAKYDNCTLSYTDNTSKVNFADYITGLAGTIQGTGQVVNEPANIPDWDSAEVISQESYTSQSIFSSTDYLSTSGTDAPGVFTFSDNAWTSVPSTMTSGTYYHFKFNPSENGYYQICYNLSAGNSGNYLYVYVNYNLELSLQASASTANNRCVDLGYITSSQYIKVTQKAITSISTLSFSIKKVAMVKTTTDIRYEGKNPNNYVWFNNEYWRIIGVFGENTHGQSGKKLVKIIRAEVLDGLVWHKSNTNDWTAASLNSLLNGAYYNATDGTGSDYCYGDGSSSIIANCDYTKRGIQSGYRGMVANVTWYLGGRSNPYVTAEAFYEYERGTTVYSGRPTSTTGYIGLMYPSDYGYSVLSSSCARTTNLGSSYSSKDCAGASWLYGKGYEWTLSPDSSSGYGGFNLRYYGDVYYTVARTGYCVRPVLYLDASVYKIDGEGSLGNPYILGV